MENEKTCPICGKPTFLVYGKYPRKDGLCYEHSQMLFSGEIEQCPDCGKWKKPQDICECRKPITKNSEGVHYKPQENETQTEENSPRKCLLCDNESGEYLFCKECYYKYKNKSIYIKITDCKNVKILNAEYEGNLTTRDGHKVKSHVERDIDNFLFLKNIPHAYEAGFDVDGNPEHEIHPDFYLPNYLGDEKDVYIEYFGMIGTKDGDEKIKYKMPIYKDKKTTLICLYPKDDNDIEAALKRKLNKNNIKEKQINFEEQI